MSRAVLSLAAIVLVLAATPAAADQPTGFTEPATLLAQASPNKTAQAYYQQQRAALDKLSAEYESASAIFDAGDTVLDREAATLKQRQILLDLHKRDYRDALARCVDPVCVKALTPPRDAINADQIALNRDIDSHNARMALREKEASRLDVMEAQLNELRDEVQRLEQDMAASKPGTAH